MLNLSTSCISIKFTEAQIHHFLPVQQTTLKYAQIDFSGAVSTYWKFSVSLNDLENEDHLHMCKCFAERA